MRFGASANTSFTLNGTPLRAEPMRFPLSLALILASGCALAQGAIDTDPAKRRPGFKPHQLSFETPKDGVARDEFRSQPFYAVILKTVERCSAVEKERIQIQNLFPANKVFAPMFECDQEPEDTIHYTNVNPKVGFIGVYAGVGSRHGGARAGVGPAARPVSRRQPTTHAGGAGLPLVQAASTLMCWTALRPSAESA